MTETLINLEAPISTFEEHLREKKKQSKNTIAGYLRHIKGFMKFIISRKIASWRNVDLATAQSYLDYLKSEGKSTRTHNLNTTSLRMFFDSLVHHKEAEYNPFYDIHHMKPPPLEPCTLSDNDIRKLVGAPRFWFEQNNKEPPKNLRAKEFRDYASYRDEVIIRLLFFAGLKTGELKLVQDTDFDRHKSLLRINTEQKSRAVFLLPNTVSVLIKALSLKQSLFLKCNHTFINDNIRVRLKYNTIYVTC